jgi:hypothetical protein
MATTKIPLGLLGIPFGLAGLSEAWLALASGQHAPVLAGRVILLISAVAWLAVVVTYLSHHLTSARPRRSGISDDLLDPIAAPFASLAFIVPILLASDGLFPLAPTPGRVITDVFITLTVLLGGWFTGQWIYGSVALDRFHPGYFLPTVAGGLIASYGAAVVGQLRWKRRPCCAARPGSSRRRPRTSSGSPTSPPLKNARTMPRHCLTRPAPSPPPAARDGSCSRSTRRARNSQISARTALSNARPSWTWTAKDERTSTVRC